VSPTPAKPRVAYQGAPGAFSEEAALALLGAEIELVPCPTFAVLFCSLDEERADYLLAPVENSLIGRIGPVTELLSASPLRVAGEIVIAVHQQLIGCPGTGFEEIATVESHPAALAQCQKFFADYPLIERIETDDTAASVARVIKRGDRSRAAIGSERAARLYGGVIIKENLEDDAKNQTRFLLLNQNRERQDQFSLTSCSALPKKNS
jgi:prephenate dehydratase